MKRILFFLLMGVCVLSCDQKMHASDLIQFVSNPENGLNKSATSGKYNINLQYKPVPFIISNEFRKNNISETEYTTRQQALDKLQYFNLKISVDEQGKDVTNYGLVDQAQQQNRLYYLSFGMKEDIRLIDGLDTLVPVAYHFERSYDLSPHRTFVIAFEKRQSSSLDKTLLFSSDMLGIEPTVIKISKNDIENIPSLKLL